MNVNVKLWINGKMVQDEVAPDTTLYTYLRNKGYKSVKCGCETANCGLCTVWVDDVSVLSCSMLVARMDGKKVTTLEGLQDEAEEFGMILAREGAEQCGSCSPGLIMNVLRMKRELENPTEESVKHYLAGNLCRCTGYMGQLRAIKKYLGISEEA